MENPLVLQLSSYLGAEGIQLAALDRLKQRMAKHAEKWKIWEDSIYPETSVDQATAEFLDENGVLWTHTYLVWSHLTIYAAVSGPEVEVRKPDSWAMSALRSLKLAVH